MDINSQTTFFNYLYSINNIPLCVFQDEALHLQIPITKGFVKRIQPYFHVLKEQNEKIAYLATNYEALYGLVRIPENNLWAFVGPYFTMPVTQETLPKILGELDMSDELESNLRIFLSTAPSGPVHRFLAYLSCIHTSLGGELISTDDIVCTSSPKRPRENIQQIYTNKRYDDPETKAAHSTYLHEMHRLELVANGDVEALRKKTTTMLPGEQGWIGSDSLRQAKNIFIAACTLYTRAAISGGLDAEEAYDLSDIYIRTCESYNNPADVERLQRTMPLDFAERVEREVKLSNVSKPIIEAIHYIKEHIDEPIQANDIADHVNLSTSYFLKRFKAETGTGVSEYITKARINEACMLLTYTDKSLTEISNYLYFSSQSYFQNVFKKLMGLTPGQYRNTKQTLGFRKALVP